MKKAFKYIDYSLSLTNKKKSMKEACLVLVTLVASASSYSFKLMELKLLHR